MSELDFVVLPQGLASDVQCQGAEGNQTGAWILPDWGGWVRYDPLKQVISIWQKMQV